LNIEQFREYCISKPGVTEEFPFDEQTLVFKVGGKMFVLTDIDEFASMNLKCDPEIVIQRMDRYPAVKPGFHMNKKYWITVDVDGSINDKLLREWIDDSYNLVFAGLPERLKNKIKGE
jgi:predicted DNA-binding protein (MmcQ/YjbR family)